MMKMRTRMKPWKKFILGSEPLELGLGLRLGCRDGNPNYYTVGIMTYYLYLQSKP
jgi:hypothetical protein